MSEKWKILLAIGESIWGLLTEKKVDSLPHDLLIAKLRGHIFGKVALVSFLLNDLGDKKETAKTENGNTE